MAKTTPTTHFDEDAKKSIGEDFAKTLVANDIDQAMAMLQTHPWLALRDMPGAPFFNQPCLHVAISMGSEPLINAMLDMGAPLERWDGERMTALFMTMHKGPKDNALRESIAWNLIERGARCDARHSSGLSLAYANNGNCSNKLFHHVVNHGAVLNGQVNGTSLLSRQILATYPDNVTNADRNELETTLRHRLRLRIEAGADLDHGNQPLNKHCLAKPLEHNDLDMANFMMENGADPLAKDNLGHNLLHWLRLQPTAVRWLMEKGVDLDAKNKWGETPIMRQLENTATANGQDYTAVIVLMTVGANLDVVDAQGPGVSMGPRAWIEAEKDAVDLQHAYRATQARSLARRVLSDIDNEAAPKTPGSCC